ncbi:MAG: LPS export ABC transporter permease LptG [Candidatus Binatia bacterium]
MRPRRFFLPTLSRHLVREFVGTFGLTLAAFLAIYILADFFDRIDLFLKNDASLGAIIRSFLFKLPLVVTQVTPMAVLAAALIGLGMLTRQNEFVALRACGVSLGQVLAPLLLVAATVAGLVFTWNETVVPYSARRWHEIDMLEIRKRGAATGFTPGREVWYRGRAGFYNIDRVASGKRTLYGLTVWQVNERFQPTRVIEVATASWTGAEWAMHNVTVREFGAAGVTVQEDGARSFVLPETFDDFRVASVEPEEFSYGMLRRQITHLRRKGVDVSESLVDLHLKLALPAASIIMMMLAVPLATRGTRVSSLAAGIGFGFAIGFSYFFVLAFARALGQTSTLPPLAAAWLANALFAVVGGYYLLGSD